MKKEVVWNAISPTRDTVSFGQTDTVVQEGGLDASLPAPRRRGLQAVIREVPTLGRTLGSATVGDAIPTHPDSTQATASVRGRTGAQACVTGAVSSHPRPRRSARRPLPTAERKARQPTPTTGDCAQPRGHPAGKSTHRRLRFSVTRNVGTRRRTHPRPLPPSDAGQLGSCTPQHSLEVGIQAD